MLAGEGLEEERVGCTFLIELIAVTGEETGELSALAR